MSDLISTPLYRSHDLGKPMPSWPHATSVCLPHWKDNIDYEEGKPRVVNKLACGYPRFVYHPFVLQLAAECEKKFARSGEKCVAFPTEKIANHCKSYLQKLGYEGVSIQNFGFYEIHCLTFPSSAIFHVREFWQHTGLVISSRQASAALAGRCPSTDGEDVHDQLKSRIAELWGGVKNEIFLFPTGMSAIFTIFRALRKYRPGRKSVQFGFPYVDTLKIQEKFGCGTHLFLGGDAQDLKSLEELLEKEEVMGIFCEFPMNPLLKSPDLGRLSQISRKYKTPLVIDDTLGSFQNVQVLPVADVLVTSLTKFFSGGGDVMGGAAMFDKTSSLSTSLLHLFKEDYENTLWSEDAIVLTKNSLDLDSRMSRINTTTERICENLIQNPFINRLFYPKYESREFYDQFKKENGGYGGVFSILLNDPETNARKFFDALELSKGPSLGTNFSLACPYTLLAHYNELDQVEKFGVSRYLIRISIGLEDFQELVNRFEMAFAHLR